MHRAEPWSQNWGAVAGGVAPGQENGLRLLLDAEISDSGPGRADTDGFRVAVNHQAGRSMKV